MNLTERDVVSVHDYLNQRGGAERVVLELSDMFPRAPICTSIYRPNSTWPQFGGRTIRTTPLDRLPVDAGFRNLFALYPWAFRSLGSIDADVVISSSSGWAHMVATTPRTLHVVYCYTPARWLYGSAYMNASLRERLIAPARDLLAARDRRAAQRADLYIAISSAVQARIKATYGLDAPVVHPPVDVERFSPRSRGDRLLVVSRLLPYKRVDAIVTAATEAGIGLDVVGRGPALDALRALAGPTVAFHGALDDAAVTELMEGCRALCLPGEEDFGLTPVEAQSAGKPVIAFAGGGALDTVVEGVTGTFFSSYEPAEIRAAIERCDVIPTAPETLAEHARRFSRAAFRSRLAAVVGERLAPGRR